MKRWYTFRTRHGTVAPSYLIRSVFPTGFFASAHSSSLFTDATTFRFVMQYR